MSNDLSEILDECVSRVREGESAADCLARYPDQAGELAPMLAAASRVAVGLKDARLSAARRQAARRAIRQAVTRQEGSRSKARPLPPILLPAWLAPVRAASVVWAGTVALAALLLWTGAAAAASQPGDLTYGVRVLAERLPALVQIGPEAHAAAELNFASRRLADVNSQFVREGKVDERALTALIQADEAAAGAVSGLSPDKRAAIAESIAHHQRALKALSEGAQAGPIQGALGRAAAQAAEVSALAAPGRPESGGRLAASATDVPASATEAPAAPASNPAPQAVLAQPAEPAGPTTLELTARPAAVVASSPVGQIRATAAPAWDSAAAGLQGVTPPGQARKAGTREPPGNPGIEPPGQAARASDTPDAASAGQGSRGAASPSERGNPPGPAAKGSDAPHDAPAERATLGPPAETRKPYNVPPGLQKGTKDNAPRVDKSAPPASSTKAPPPPKK